MLYRYSFDITKGFKETAIELCISINAESDVPEQKESVFWIVSYLLYGCWQQIIGYWDHRGWMIREQLNHCVFLEMKELGEMGIYVEKNKWII